LTGSKCCFQLGQSKALTQNNLIMNNALAQVMEESLKQVWSEHDPNRRIKAIESLYAKDYTVFEVDEVITGYDALNHKVSNTLNGMPPDFVFTRLKPVVINNNVGRMVWGLGPKDKPVIATGMDVVIFENGKIKSLYVFLDN
jgi:hypothetical protein